MKYMITAIKGDSVVELNLRTLKGVAYVCSEAMAIAGMRKRADAWLNGDGEGLATRAQCHRLANGLRRLLKDDPELEQELTAKERSALGELETFLPTCGGFEVY